MVWYYSTGESRNLGTLVFIVYTNNHQKPQRLLVANRRMEGGGGRIPSVDGWAGSLAI